MHGLPLASDPLGFLGALIVIIIFFLIFGIFMAATFGPIALVVAAIIKAFRTSTVTNAPRITMSSPELMSESQVVVLPGLGSFGQALGAGLQGALGQQLGQQLGQMLAAAAAQHPLAFQVAPIVMIIEAARRQGDIARIRPLLTDQFASRFPVSAPAGIAHIALANADAPAHGDHVVVRIDRNAGVTVHSEYWSFQRAAPAAQQGTPEKCPQCGAPTAGDYSGTCRFCGATFSTTPVVLPQPTRWLLDDISETPPALAA